MSDHAQAFLAAVRGIPGHHVAQALNELTPGVNWSKCSKGSLADYYANAKLRGSRAVFPRIGRVDIARLARMAKARAAGDPLWRSRP